MPCTLSYCEWYMAFMIGHKEFHGFIGSSDSLFNDFHAGVFKFDIDKVYAIIITKAFL